MQGLVGQQRHAAGGHRVDVTHGMQEPGHAVLDHFGQSAGVRGDDRHLAGHRLERGQAEALLLGRQEEQIRDRQQRHHVFLRAEKLHAIRDVELPRQPARCGDLRAVAGQQQHGRHARGDAREHLDDRIDPLDRTEIREVHHDLASLVAGVAPPQVRHRDALVGVAVEEVRNDVDRRACTASSRQVASRRLSDTAVTPSD